MQLRPLETVYASADDEVRAVDPRLHDQQSNVCDEAHNVHTSRERIVLLVLAPRRVMDRDEHGRA